jgi:hypothetical protein
VPEAEPEPLPLDVPVIEVPDVPVVDVPVVVPVVPPGLPVVTALPVPPAIPLFDIGTPVVWPDAEPVDEPAAALPLLTFPVDVEHADSTTTPAIPTDALIHFMVIFAL